MSLKPSEASALPPPPTLPQQGSQELLVFLEHLTAIIRGVSQHPPPPFPPAPTPGPSPTSPALWPFSGCGMWWQGQLPRGRLPCTPRPRTCPGLPWHEEPPMPPMSAPCQPGARLWDGMRFGHTKRTGQEPLLVAWGTRGCPLSALHIQRLLFPVGPVGPDTMRGE